MSASIRTPGSPAALTGLLDRLKAADYAFVSPTPATHGHVASRLQSARPGDLRDVFGWGRPFTEADVGEDLYALLIQGALLEDAGDAVRSIVRVSTLDGRLHLHSARSARDAVFLGPDSYRFVRFLLDVLERGPPPGAVLDIGAGAGAGALAMAIRLPSARVVATDVNPLALHYLTANARHAETRVETILGSGSEAANGVYDLIIANPPYLVDSDRRTYRHGGGPLGLDLALEWVEGGLGRLSEGGRFALYTGSPIVEGRDLLQAKLADLARAKGAVVTYEELDPDVFGGMLRQDAYANVERIAAIGAVLSL